MPTIRIADADLAYDLSGPSRAPVVVLGNALGASSDMWDALASALRGRYRVLRYEPRPEAASIDAFAADLAGLLDALAIDRAHLVGHSLGAATMLRLAERDQGRCLSLTLMGIAPGRAQDLAERARRARGESMTALAGEMAREWFTPAFRESETARDWRARLAAADPDGFASAAEALAETDLASSLAQAAAPCLVLTGRNDPRTPPDAAEALAASIPNADLAVLHNAAHLCAVERPDATARAVSAFLDAVTEGIPAQVGPTPYAEAIGNREDVLGLEHVARALATAGAFAEPWQDFITRVAWGEIWGDPTLPWKTRSLVTLALMLALGREEEFKLHLRPALHNGVRLSELRALLTHAAVYAGVPVANAAFRWTREVLGDALDSAEE